jgi:hypothetical protein
MLATALVVVLVAVLVAVAVEVKPLVLLPAQPPRPAGPETRCITAIADVSFARAEAYSKGREGARLSGCRTG